jgi:S-adenosylmethionine:diacylglycerol 3-amino-3-carboxypropyl transferase
MTEKYGVHHRGTETQRQYETLSSSGSQCLSVSVVYSSGGRKMLAYLTAQPAAKWGLVTPRKSRI